tara:strand:+ start:545 stop:847 length:303 start_codon:yes stop_codon:yes gene_type:complete
MKTVSVILTVDQVQLEISSLKDRLLNAKSRLHSIYDEYGVLKPHWANREEQYKRVVNDLMYTKYSMELALAQELGVNHPIPVNNDTHSIKPVQDYSSTEH